MMASGVWRSKHALACTKVKHYIRVQIEMTVLCSANLSIIHLLDRTKTNIIFIWSSKVILGR